MTPPIRVVLPPRAALRALLTRILVYFAAMVLGLWLSRFDKGVAIVWMPSAVLFVALFTTPRRRRGLLVAAALPSAILAITLFGFGTVAAFPLALINVVEAWASAWLVRRLHPRFGRLDSVHETMVFLGIAGMLVPGISALLAAGVIHAVVGMPFGIACRDWFAAHALGLIAFSPPLLLAMRGEAQRWVRTASPAQRREAIALLLAVVVSALVTFGQDIVPLVLLPMITMVAATLRCGRFGAMISVVILMVIGLVATYWGHGPTALLPQGMVVKFEILQIYFACVVLVLLPLAAELTARQRLLERVRAGDTLHRLIIERASDVIMRVNVAGEVRFVSPSAARVWGYLPHELVGQSVYDIIHPRDAPAVRAARHVVLGSHDASIVVEYRTLARDGREVSVESSTRVVRDHVGAVTGTISVIRDVTERRAMIDDLARQALSDPLTGLANRRAFDRELARMLASGEAGQRAGCLALFDLDHFKAINDRFGHGTGDRVLRAFAQVLRSRAGGSDLPARIGGEEFALLLPGTTRPEARALCERIRTGFAAAVTELGDDPDLGATTSAGLACLISGSSPEAVLTAADTALYRAKHDGRNRVAVSA